MNAILPYFNLFSYSASKIEFNDEEEINFTEVMLNSWAFHLLWSIYYVALFLIGVKLGPVKLSLLPMRLKIFSMFFLFSCQIIYPLIFVIYYKFWMKIISWSNKLFMSDEENSRINDHDDKKKQIVLGAFSSNLLLIIPVIGNVLSYFAFIFFVYQGLQKHLNYRPVQCIAILLAPAFIIFLIFVMMALYLIFLLGIL